MPSRVGSMPRGEARRAAPVPTLALVDAFVGGLAVLLILIVLSSQTEPKQGERPMPDLTLACVGDRLVRGGEGGGTLADWPEEGSVPEKAVDVLATLSPADAGDGLSVRVRLEAHVDDLSCASQFTRAIHQQNDETDAVEDARSGGMHLLVSLHLLEDSAH